MPDKIKDSKGDEHDRRDEDPPTTSKGDTLNPERDSHNMDDLKGLDFNSADEVRQAMKSIISGKVFCDDEESVTIIDKHSTLTSPIHTIDTQKRILSDDQAHRDSLLTTTPIVTRKRPGRPPKAGPSWKIRRMNVTDMYLGKLSNVVPFKNKKGKYEYESDTDTLYVFRL